MEAQGVGAAEVGDATDEKVGAVVQAPLDAGGRETADDADERAEREEPGPSRGGLGQARQSDAQTVHGEIIQEHNAT